MLVSYINVIIQSFFSAAHHTVETLRSVMLTAVPGFAHKVSLHLLFVCAIFVFSHQHVVAIVEVCGAVQLQAPMVLYICDIMNHGLDVVALLHCLTITKPL